MKKFILVFSATLLVSFLSAQKVVNNNLEDTVIKSTNAKTHTIDDSFNAIAQLLNSKAFVIEANTITDKWGNQQMVNSNLNFIRVDSLQSTIQIGNGIGIGPNGVGGVTVEGSISSWKLVKDEKHKSFSLRMNVSTPLSFYDVFISANTSGYATATVSGMTSNNLTFRGQLVPLEDSKIYVGSHL